jgi:hypothetical protein
MNNQELVKKIDAAAAKIIQNGGDEATLVIGLVDHKDDLYRVLKTSSQEQLEGYCKQFPSFYEYITIIYKIAAFMKEGKMPNPFSKPNPKHKADTETSPSHKALEDLQEILTQSILKMRKLGSLDAKDQAEVVPMLSLFLLATISNAAELIELDIPGSGAYLYGEIEAGAKIGGINAIAKAVQDGAPHYSVSGIDENDLPTAMNYIGQQLLMALIKAMHELPKPLRIDEIQLRGIEALLANILHQKFDNPHVALDTFCAHVHRALHDLTGNARVPHSLCIEPIP